MLKLVIVAALVAVTIADSGGGDLYSEGVLRTRLSQQCAGVCKGSSKFRLQPGLTYLYSYEGTTTSEVAGSSNDTSQIRITAKAHVRVSSRPCDLILVVRDVQLLDLGSKGLESAVHQKEFASELEQFPLRFSFQDGRVEQLCPSVDEPTWVLNIKRGLLSAFQNSMPDFSKDSHLYEKDVSGSCETTYIAKPLIWNDVKVLRHKNLHSCSGRKHHPLGLPVSWAAGAKSVPIIKSEQICEQTIKTDNGSYLANSRCQETHVFAPFSNGESGIRTSVEVNLTLDNVIETEDVIPVELFVNKRTSLQFDYSLEGTEDAETFEDVWKTLNQLISHSQLGVDSSVPQLFDQLVSQLSRVDDQQLVKLFDEVQDKRARGFLMDALPLVGSGGSVKAMYQIYSAKEVSREEVDSWLTALAFHRQPTLDILDTLNLFMLEGYHSKTWLAVSAIVHSYCRLDPTCSERPQVQALMVPMEAVLGQSCLSTSRQQQEQVITALKAVGNAGLLSSLDILENCVTSEQNPTEVRLAAIAATRRFPCSKVLRLPLLPMFQDKREDSEVRIAAYLALVQCPTTAIVSKIKDTLYSEDINQVMSFVWTHLTNLQESSSSWRKEIRQMLQDNYLANKFKTDARKFSRNYEMSLYSDMLNTGVTADSNIIFSTKSYLPRSANLNLTLDIFGETINIFEVGARLKGFESIVEEIFSPKGFFPDESMQKMLRNMREADKEKNEVIQSFSEQFTKDTTNEPQGTVFVRIFGNELYLSQFASLYDLNDFKNMKKHSLKYFKDSLSSIFNKKNVDFTKSFRFINTEHVVPTILGLPLKVKVNGTASVGMQLKTEVDLDSILKSSNGNIVLSINPSAAMKIDGKMMVDAVFAQAGVETKGSLSSNTYLDTKITLENGRVLDVFINVPREKVEVINVTSAVFVRQRDDLFEIEGVGDASAHDSCSGEHVPTLSGMRVCSQFVLRNASAVEDSPYFPLTGRFQYALALQKSDDFEYYQFHLKQNYKVTPDTESNRRYYSGDFTVEVDTPGSRLNRRIAGDLFFDTETGDAKLEIESPAGSVGFSGRLSLSDESKSLDIKAKANGEDYAALKLGLQIENTLRTVRYEPSFLLQVLPSNINLNVTGHLNIVPGSKYSADVTAAGFTRQPLVFAGDMSGAKGRYSASLAAKAEAVDIKINSHVVNTAAVQSCKTLIRYVLPGKSVQSVDFSGKLQDHKRGGFTKKQLWINLQMSELPQYSTKMGWILYRTKMYLDSNMELTVGKTQWKSQQLYHNNLQDKNKNFEVILSLESPTKHLDYRAELQYKTTDETIHSHALAQLSKTKRFISRLDYEHSFPLHSLEVEVATPWKRALLEGKLETPPGSATVNTTVLLKWGTIDNPYWLSATGRYRVAESALSAQHTVEGRLEALDWQDPMEVEGQWNARSEDGVIISDSKITVVVSKREYSLDVEYVKNSLMGKHNLNVDLALPDNSYSGKFCLINNQEMKNVTIRLDLEKTLYFTTQLKLWRAFDLQLFWDYQRDKSQSVLIQYKNSPMSEVAIVSMPGHYASLTVDKLGPGFSSMNITAMWGESEGSASNAMLLTTYWLLDLPSDIVFLPNVQTRVHLITPFVGFEQQSFILSVNGSVDYSMTGVTVIRTVNVSTKWQDQYINFDFNQNTTVQAIVQPSGEYKGQESFSSFTSTITSSLEAVRDVSIMTLIEDKKDDFSSSFEGMNVKRNYILDVSYNNWAALTFNSSYTPAQLSVFVDLRNMEKQETLLSGKLSAQDGLIILQSSFPSNKKVFFRSTYKWPNNLIITLETPFRGYEQSAVQYDFSMVDDNIATKVSGEVGKEYLLFLMDLHKSPSGVSGNLNISSSSSVPDISVKVEHELDKKQHKISLRESVKICLSKGGKLLQSGQGMLSFVDEQSSISSKIRQLETVVELPGHSSSLNYTYQKQVKTTGVEVTHEVSQLWNSEKLDLSLVYEGLNFVAGILRKNRDKKVEFSFKKLGSKNYKSDLFLSGGYSVKHRLFFTDYPNWENFLAVTSPSAGKVIMRNLQTMNSEGTNFVHKSTLLFNKEEMAHLDFVVNRDSELRKLEKVFFSTATPWNHPIVAKYDLLIDTGVTSKHEVEFKLKQNQEIKLIFDVTSSESKHSASFNLYSPYCKDLGGKLSFECDSNKSKGNLLLNINEKQLAADFELVQNIQNPLLAINLNVSSEKTIQIFTTYDIRNIKKEGKVVISYYGTELNLDAHYMFNQNSIKSGFAVKSPMLGWREVSVDFDSVLLQKYSMFALNCKKEEHFLILSGTGSFRSDLLKSSIALDYSFNKVPKKHSALFEYTRGRDSVSVSFNCKNNEISVMDLNAQFLKESGTVINQDSYLFTYKAHTPLEVLPDSNVDIKFIKNDKAQKVTGNFNINNSSVIIKGENTFDHTGFGYFDFNALTSDRKIEVFVKHISGSDENDTYSLYVTHNDQFVNGMITLSTSENGLEVKYGLESSIQRLGSLNGTTRVYSEIDSFSFDSSLIANGNNYNSSYKVMFGQNDDNKTKHILLVSLPIEGFEAIKGNLEYSYIDSVYLKGEISNSQALSTVFYSKTSQSEWIFKIDVTEMFTLSAQCQTSQFELSAKTVQSQGNPNFLIDLTLTESSILFETDNTVTGKLQFIANNNNSTKYSFLAIVSGIKTNGALHVSNDSINLDVVSNIPDWSELKVFVKRSSSDEMIKRYYISIRKNNQDLLHLTIEGVYNSYQGNGLLSITMQKFFIEVDLNCDFSSNFSLDMRYNINGDKQYSGGKISFLPETTRIELVTPIKGFEDISVVSNYNRKGKKIGLVFQRNGKSLGVEFSITVERNRAIFKGTVTNGKEEFLVSIGIQNGTTEEPKSASFYITAFKNKLSIFMLSLDGSYDLEIKAGVKLSFSSYYYKQLYFEISSHKEEFKHNFMFSYLYGIDIAYFFKAGIVKNLDNPRLSIESQLGSHNIYLEALYNLQNLTKTAALQFKWNEDMLFNMIGEASFAMTDSKLKLIMENKNVLNDISNLNISGEYYFANTSLVNGVIVANDIKYFDLSMKSSSLYNVEFVSSLVPFKFMNNSYYVALHYNLALPEASISSNVQINEDYYKSKANLTWSESVIRTFFQLNTNAGYGFENATLSVHYGASKSYSYSHLIDFTVDDSILFHVSSDITYPNQFSVDIVLPDSLFLPFIKEISVRFSVTEEEKKILLKYISGSNEKNKLNFLVLLQEHECSVLMERSEVNGEGVLRSDHFSIAYTLLGNILEFETSLMWENDNLFSVSYSKEASMFPDEEERFSQVLFSSGKHHSWKVIIMNNDTFECSGIINSSEMKLVLTHPSTVFHNYSGLTELLYSNNIEEWNVFKVNYDYRKAVHLEIQFNNPVSYIERLSTSENGISSSSHMKLKLRDRVINMNEDFFCESVMLPGRKYCAKHLYQVNISGITKYPLSLQLKSDILASELNGILLTGNQNYTFGGKVKINYDSLACSNFDVSLNTSFRPETTLSLKYETNCINYVNVAVNMFEKNPRSLRVIFDFNDVISKRFYIQGANIYYENWNISIDLTKDAIASTMNLEVNLEKNNIQIALGLDRIKGSSLSVETSYKELKKLELIHERDYESQEDSLKEKYKGKFKLEGEKTFTEWKYELLSLDDGSLIFKLQTNKDLLIDMSFESNDKVLFVKVEKNGKIYRGEGSINNYSDKKQMHGSAKITLDGEKYELNFENFESLEEYKASIRLNTPLEDYFVIFDLQKKFDYQSSETFRSATIKYKTPFNPLEFADFKIKYSLRPLICQEVFPVKELELTDTREEEKFEVCYNELIFGLSLKYKNINVEDAHVSVTYGDKYSVNFTHLTKKITLESFLLRNTKSLTSHTTISVEGINCMYLDKLRGNTLLKAHLNMATYSALVSLETPFMENVLITSKCKKNYVNVNEKYESFNYYIEHNHTAKVVFGKLTVLKLAAYSYSNESNIESHTFKQITVNGQWEGKNVVNSDLIVIIRNNNEDLEVSFGVKSCVIEFQSQYSTQKTDNTLLKSFALNVNNSFLAEAFSPNIVFKRETNQDSSVQYNLNFSTGFQNEQFIYSGRGSLKLPNLKSFSVDTNPSGFVDIYLESTFAQYSAVSNLLFQRNRMDVLIKWRKLIKSIKYSQDPEFSYLNFGGQLQRNTVELYLNENKFWGSIESSKTQTSISANLVNSKISKNITIFASVQYTPIFLMTISHTVFDSPCSIEIKVDRKSESIESAVTIMYNSLKQQAFVNVYLDSNPRYIELVYIDIWQQTHEVSGQVEEKDDEVTLKGKINSPALDENFLIITVGNNNDKFDLNLSDMLIFKVFKDSKSALFNLFVFENDYKLHYKCEDDVSEVSINSSELSGLAMYNLNRNWSKSFAKGQIDVGTYNFVLNINDDKLFTVILTNRGENIFQTTVEIDNDTCFDLQFQCDILEHTNSLHVKHTSSPVLLDLCLSSSYYLKSELEVLFGITNEELITGIFEIKQETSLFKSYLAVSKANGTLEMTAEVPLFSEMDKAKINGIFRCVDSDDCEMKVSAAISSAETLMAHSSLHFINNDEVFSSGLVVKSKLKDFEDVEVTVHIPRILSRDMKANLLIQFPYSKPYEFSFSLCLSESSVISSAVARWQDWICSLEYKYGNAPFYAHLYEWNIQYLKTKVQIGAWMKPKDPLTDYIYFIDIDDKRIIQLSHALILQHNHFKSKLIVESAFEGHKKYGVDFEVQNLKVGKIVRILGSVPQLGSDLGVDFGFSYESLLNYAVLAQIRIPYGTQVKMARLNSFQKIQTHLNLIKVNHTLECEDIGIIGLEFEMLGSAPFFWQEDVSSLETRINLNNNIYTVKTKSYLQPSKIQIACILEAPFEHFQKGEFQLSGTKHLVGSELVFTLNSNELINASISEDLTNTKHIQILSKWRNILFKYLYEVYYDELAVNGYICWDLNKRDISQLGLSISGRKLEKYETSAELLLPSTLIPKLSVKAAFSNKINELFSLLQIDFPGLLLEGKLANNISPGMWKSGIQLMWTPLNSPCKTIGLFYVTETNDDEIKYYFTLQHFALQNDLMLTTYIKNTLYGLSVQYSQLKEEEITLEFGHWSLLDGDKERSGVKFTALHPASNTLIYSVGNVTSTSEFIEAGLSVAFVDKHESNRIKYIELYGNRNRKTPQIILGLSSNGNTLGISGSIWKKENSLNGMTIETRVNQKDPFRFEVVQNTAHPGIEAELSYSLSRTYRVFAGMPNNNEITAQLSHSMYGWPSIDALASLRLNTSRILWGRFEFPPITQIAQEFYSGILEEYSDVTLVSQAVTDGFVDFLNEDFSGKILLLFNGVSRQSNVLIHQTSIELDVIIRGFKHFTETVQKAYEMDHFYMKTYIQHLKHLGMTVQNSASCVFSAVEETLNGLFSPFIKILSRVRQVVDSLLDQWIRFITEIGAGGLHPLSQISDLVGRYQSFRKFLIEQARQAVTSLRGKLTMLEHQSGQWLAQGELEVNRMIRSVQDIIAAQMQRVVDYSQTLLTGFSVLGKTVEEMVEIVRDGIYQIREVRLSLEWAVKVIDALNTWFANYRIETYLRELSEYLDKVVQLIKSDIENNFGEYEVYLVRAQQILAGQYEELSKIPQVHYFTSAANQLYQKIKWFWSYAKLNERLKDTVKKYIENMKATLDDIENQLDREEADLRLEYVYNAENNSLTFTQELPFEWKSFNELPEYNVEINSSPFTIPAQDYSNMVQTMASYLWQDAKLLPYVLPPLGADAIVSGDGVVTFDSSYYKIPGACGSYLLAADLYHDTFSLVASFDHKGKGDLLLTTQNIEILLKKNLEVYVNGRLEDLPLRLNNGKSIHLERKVQSVSISSEDGFSLDCNSYLEMCKFHVDGWYTGKVAGLFGTYNNEPTDDFINPKREFVESIKEFTESWLVKGNFCESTEVAASSEEEPRSYEPLCEQFFSSQSSPFYPCFHVVDPKAFYEMCLTKSHRDNTCASVLAYLTKCTSSGVQLWMPEFCGTVEPSISDSLVVASYSDIVEIPSKMAADVVFVVEEARCVQNDQLDFKTLVTSLNTELETNGLTTNRFAFISFDDKNAQIQTINGHVWTEDKKLFSNVISRLDGNSEGPSSYTSALDLVTNLSFRPGASKIAVLIHCSSCPIDQPHAATLERFTQQDLSLHVLQQDHILGKRGKVVSKAIGLEKTGAYPRKRLAKNVSPNPQLLQQVSVPQDLCTPVVLGTNGTLFHLDVTRKAMRAWAGRLAKGAIPPSPLSLCESSVASDNTPVWKCHWAMQQSRLKDWDQTALVEYMDNSRGAEIYPEYEEVDR